MTILAPDYTARVTGWGITDIPVTLRDDDGSIVLDSTRMPHVTATVKLALPDVAPTLLDALDPRMGRRMVITASGREFDLGIRTVVPDREEGTVTVELASDEAMAEDYRNLGGGDDAYAYETSLRALCDYVLGAATARNNLDVNPKAVASGSDAAYAVRNSWTRVFSTSASSPGALPFNTIARSTSTETGTVTNRGYDSYGSTAVSTPGTSGVWVAGPMLAPGNMLTISRYLRAGNAGTPTWRLGVRFHDGAGNWVGATTYSTQSAASGWNRMSITLMVPEGASYVSVYAGFLSATVTTSSYIDMTGLLMEYASALGPWREGVLTYGTLDADVSAKWQVTNLAPNATVRTVLTGWAAGTGASAVARDATNTMGGLPTVVFGATSTGLAYLNTPAQAISVRGGMEFHAHAMIASNTTSRMASMMVRFNDASGARIKDIEGNPVATSTSRAAPTQIHFRGEAPPDAASAFVYIKVASNSVGQNHHVNQLMVTKDEFRDIAFFDGSTVETGDYFYGYDGDQYLSSSTRYPQAGIERDPESLVWQPGDTPMDLLRPLVQSVGMRLVCDEQRRWTLRDENWRTSGSQQFRDGVNLITAGEELSRDSDEWFNVALYVYKWTDRQGIEQVRYDVGFPDVFDTATKIVRRDIAAPFPGEGRAAYAVRRARGRGRTVTATRQARWNESAEQEFSALLAGSPVLVGVVDRVEFDLATNTVTTTSRTTDTPAGAIDLLTGTINALTGTINNL